MANCLRVQSDTKFSSFIHNNYNTLLTDSTICDVQFEIVSGNGCNHNEEDDVDTHIYYGCRALFAIHSEVFRNMLYGSMMEADCTNIVRLNDISCETFEFIQKCFYGLNPMLSSINVVPILCASDKYLIKPLKNLCINFILNLATKNENNHSIENTLNHNNNQNESAISMFLSSLNLLFYAQQIDIINTIISSISKSHSNCTKIWNSILYDKNFYHLHHSLIKLILLHLIKLNNTLKNKNESIQIPSSKLWLQCKKWCQFQVNLINNNNGKHPQKIKTNNNNNNNNDVNMDNIDNIDIDKKDKNDDDIDNDNMDGKNEENEDENVIDDEKLDEIPKLKWYNLMKKYFKTDNLIISILMEANPYFFMKHKSEIIKILNMAELNKIYEHFLYKKTKSNGSDINDNDNDSDINELKLCSDNVLYLYDNFRRITRSNSGDTEFIRCASDIGWNGGIHQFTVKCYITGNQASIGIVTNPKSFIDPQSAFPFDINEVGISYYWYGSNVYGYRYGAQQFNHSIGYEWQNNDIISIIINCNKWTIQFMKNYEKIGKIIKIIPDQYYYVALCDGIYSEEVYYEGLIDYKVLVCQ